MTLDPLEINNKIKNKAVKLFTYIENVLKIDEKIIRDFRTIIIENSIWWKSDFQDINTCAFRNFDYNENEDNETSWLKVERKKITQPPELPKVLVEWVSKADLNNPLIELKPIQVISRKIYFDDDENRKNDYAKLINTFVALMEVPKTLVNWVTMKSNGRLEKIEFIYQDDKFYSHPELQQLFNQYLQNEWINWAKEARGIYKANTLFDQLYALRLTLKNHSEDYELLWGHGLLTWKYAMDSDLIWPIFLTPLIIDHDANNNIIRISPDLMLKPYIDLSPLQELGLAAEVEILAWMDKNNQNPIDFWNYEQLSRESRWLLGSISPKYENNFEKEEQAKYESLENPSFWNTNMIFVRKRSNSAWSKYAGLIRRDIQNSQSELTDFVVDLIGEYDFKNKIENRHSTNENQHVLNDGELYFPLPWNDEQKSIATAIDHNYGVVIKGPPGTGKSHTIANMISRFLAQGKTVLVTSQTSKALEVIRDKLPTEIQSLAVSQIGHNIKSDQMLQASISEINANLSQTTKYNTSVEDSIRAKLNDIRKQKTVIANKIRETILLDSSTSTTIDGYKVTPLEAAKIVSDYNTRNNSNWFEDLIDIEAKLNFTDDDIANYYDACLKLEEQYKYLETVEIPSIDRLPNSYEMSTIFSEIYSLENQFKLAQSQLKLNKDYLKEDLINIIELIERKIAVLNACDLEYEQHIFNSCYESEAERKKWKSISNRAREHLTKIQNAELELVGYIVTGDLDNKIDYALDGIYEILKIYEQKSNINLIDKILLSNNAKKVLNILKINGNLPNKYDEFVLLKSYFLKKKHRNELNILISQELDHFDGLKMERISSLSILQLENLLKNIDVFIHSHDYENILEDFINSQKLKEALDLNNLDTLIYLANTLKLYIQSSEINNLESKLNAFKSYLLGFVQNECLITDDLLCAIEKKDVDLWDKSINKLRDLEKRKFNAKISKELSEKISTNAPTLVKRVSEAAFKKISFIRPTSIVEAWTISKYTKWLSKLHAEHNIQELQLRYEQLNIQEREKNTELIATLAWKRQIARVTEPQKQALVAWALFMKKVGKMQGKYWKKHLRDAQDALDTAKDAVPVWIMPINRVQQMFPNPKSGMFDVIIFDEASQCDIKGICAAYLGKKILVVGDPDQISPAGLFQNIEKVNELVGRYLEDIPVKNSFSIDSSLFDIAQVRLSNSIMLCEHFRSVPEIISFSNFYIYENKIKPLRYPQPNGKLAPALIPILVKDGYQNKNNKVNEPEAEAVVNKLLECLSDPKYDKRPDGKKCTFGIISLLAEDQAKYIKELVYNKIDLKTIEERKIEIGDAYTFQGDERDVIFLSMVKALDPDNIHDTIRGITDESTKRRYNVASSRAKDQMFLFHSVSLEKLNNKEDWRWKLLNWFYNPQNEKLKYSLEALDKEYNSGRASIFSYEVGKTLIERGYQVIAEFPVIGYRIDLVVQGENSRLAIECDGDQYHTLENFDADQAREAQLRRAGWEFWRINGSAYYKNKEEALKSLWVKLNQMDINPSHKLY